jgi:TrmH family RNA methyltransferase
MISSRDNPRVKRWMKLAQDARFRKRERRALVEGPHLVTALLDARLAPLELLVSEEKIGDPEIQKLIKRAGIAPQELSQSVFKAIADTETPQGIAAEIEIPDSKEASKGNCVFLEGIQDAGNVGAIIRSAAAFGIASIVLDRACADPWSPKALRAGMGGHFGLTIAASDDLSPLLSTFSGKLLCTVPKEGTALKDADLSGRLGWVLGSEGKGISAQALQEADVKITIPTAPGTESLNVAATAAICLYEAFSRPQAAKARP